MVKPEAAAAPKTGEASEVAAPQTTATYRNVARHSAMTDRQSSRVRSSACMGISCGLALDCHRRPPDPGYLFRSSRSIASNIMFRWWSRSAPSSFRFMFATEFGRERSRKSWSARVRWHCGGYAPGRCVARLCVLVYVPSARRTANDWADCWGRRRSRRWQVVASKTCPLKKTRRGRLSFPPTMGRVHPACIFRPTQPRGSDDLQRTMHTLQRSSRARSIPQKMNQLS